jgi:Na+/H+-dicarboxylate symporter
VTIVDNPKVKKADGMNILGLVVFSIFFGCTLSKMGKTGKPLADFFECMHLATMKLFMPSAFLTLGLSTFQVTKYGTVSEII